MQSVSFVFLFLAGVCVTLGNPTSSEQSALILRQEQFDVVANIKLLIEQLVQNLEKAAKDAMDAVAIFRDGLIEQMVSLREKTTEDIAKLRERIRQAMQDVYDRFTNSGQAVRECINSHKGQAESLFNDTVTQSMACADNRIKDIGEQMEALTNLSNNASNYATSAIDEMRECLEKNSADMVTVGTCLSNIALRTEMRGAVFIAQSGLRITRLNLALATLPTALEICAGSRIFQAGLSTTRIIMGIGSCSATSIFSSLTGPSLY